MARDHFFANPKRPNANVGTAYVYSNSEMHFKSQLKVIHINWNDWTNLSSVR